MSELDAVRYIGTPIALAAFAVAIGARLYSRHLRNKIERIRQLPEADRLRFAEKELETYSIPPENDNLTSDQKFSLMQIVVTQRGTRLRLLFRFSIAIALIVAATLVVTIYIQRKADAIPASVTIDLSGVGSTKTDEDIFKNTDTLFVESFTVPNKDLWLVGQRGEWFGKIANGEYCLTNTTDPKGGKYIFTLSDDADLTKSPVSLDVKPPSEDANSLASVGLLVNFQKSSTSFYAFTISSSRQFSFARISPGTAVTLHSGRSDLIKPDGYNRLAIRKTPGIFKLYINDKLVKVVNDDKLPEGAPGVFVLAACRT